MSRCPGRSRTLVIVLLIVLLHGCDSSGGGDGPAVAPDESIDVPPPLAAVRIQASVVSGDAPLRVRFAPVLDSSTAINRLYWDFEGDGGPIDGGTGIDAAGFDRLTGLSTGSADHDVTGQDVLHVFERAGEFTVRVRVLDVDGNADEDSLIVTVRNSPPAGYVAAVPNRGQAPLSVAFTANATDAEGIERYDRDFDADGIVDETGTRRSASFTYERVGDYRPVVVAHDIEGQSADLSSILTSVSVTQAAVPVVSLSPNAVDGAW